MIRCKILKSSPLSLDSDYYDPERERRCYWQSYMLELRVGSRTPVRLSGWHFVTVNEDGDVDVADRDRVYTGIPRVREMLGGAYEIYTSQNMYCIMADAGRKDEMERVIQCAADSIEYMYPK